MMIKYKDTFIIRLEKQLSYISVDNTSAALKFKNELIKRIKTIPINPLIFRKSIYFDDITVRDLIYKGYCIVFKINSKDNTIEVFGFLKQQSKPID